MEKQLDDTHEVTVPEMLAARDHRVELQRQFIERFHCPVICFMLNIPGPHKVGDDFYWAFEAGLQRIQAALDQNGIRIEAEKEEAELTGYVYYAAVDAEAVRVKELMCLLEDADRLGRIFDIDVIKKDGMKVSREEFGMPPRKCLMCEKEAHLCARNRTHRVSDMVAEIHHIIEEARSR
ncbi:MAG TPA: citrate lyase holo-[acyl-carrier protein] synthase [Oribacterium sp.]|nr:citrate lyase holo-[acyl-carrier protein] synthase [Oribacterium sp.]HCS66662.1 citrate lyase holo-[acyl-carrier protein] synthase [Oribacterium sp.]